MKCINLSILKIICTQVKHDICDKFLLPFIFQLEIRPTFLHRFQSKYLFSYQQCKWHHVGKVMLLCRCCLCFNSSPPGQDGCHFADYIFRCIFVNEELCILIKIISQGFPRQKISIFITCTIDGITVNSLWFVDSI